MGSNSASTGGGGGGVGPAGIKTDGTYGTKKDAKKASRRNEFRTFVKGGGVVGAIIKGLVPSAKEANLKRRKAFIKRKGLTGDDINMSDDYLSSKEGLAELKKQGYTTVSDLTPSGNDNDGGGNQVGQTTTMAAATAPTTAEVSQSSATDATDVATVDTDDPTYIKRKNKRVGRSLTILTSSKGATDGLTLGKRSLLGQA